MLGLISLIAVAFQVLQIVNCVSLTVSSTGGNDSSPLLYGLMFEDINNSGDGGVHGQLLSNNGLQGPDPTFDTYNAVGGTTLAIDTANPLTSAIATTLKVTVPSGATGQVGFSNSGYDGVPVNQDTYSSYFWVKGAYSGSMTVQLVGGDGTSYASKDVDVTSNGTAFTYIQTTLDSKQAPSGDNVWQVTFDAASATDGSLNFGLVQLFPTTYHGRANGLRNDVATFMEKIGGSFLRWPGGNNLEGNAIDTRWTWNETIGPVEDRPGHVGTWSYVNTDALGLMEYAQWTEDMGLENVLAVWAGHTLDGTSVSGAALDPYVDDIMNELEFMLGDTSTTYGGLRAQYGRSDPYTVRYVEVGNEDNISGGCGSYASRFTDIYNAIHAAYPDITVIASTTDSKCLPSPLPEGAWTDIHYYLSPDRFVSQFNEFDNQPRDHPIFVGEYASTSGNDGSQTYWSYLQGSCAEAVYMIGLERNSDVVKMASFAPLLEHFNRAEWSPDLFGFDSDPGSLTGSTSYYVQQMFASNRGSTILPVTSDSPFGPVYWVASSKSGGTYYVKMANYGTSTESVTVSIPNVAVGSAEVQMLSGGATQSNFPLNVTVTPQSRSIQPGDEGGYTVSMDPYSVAVLILSP